MKSRKNILLSTTATLPLVFGLALAVPAAVGVATMDAGSAYAACNPCNPCKANACNPCNPCNPCAAAGLQPVQPLRGEEPVQSLQPLQSMRCQERVVPHARGSLLQ